MRLEDMREQFPKMPESMKQMIEQEVAVQIGQEKENDNPKVVTYKKRKKKNIEKKKISFNEDKINQCLIGTCNNGLCRCCLPDA